ncbi:hypothetical protein [Sphingomonas glacialis]|uniref:hypothetical protein n=1 Tax=Sphingomonas glacialis TaxID=658225 RepID=UPI00112B78ED|nr:hypothetical protein [Sphingomonas glacialis]
MDDRKAARPRFYRLRWLARARNGDWSAAASIELVRARLFVQKAIMRIKQTTFYELAMSRPYSLPQEELKRTARAWPGPAVPRIREACLR